MIDKGTYRSINLLSPNRKEDWLWGVKSEGFF
jgi:hypothetical protein